MYLKIVFIVVLKEVFCFIILSKQKQPYKVLRKVFSQSKTQFLRTEKVAFLRVFLLLFPPTSILLQTLHFQAGKGTKYCSKKY